jgi:asparagine synthase (glutamine-hydrolysing)
MSAQAGIWYFDPSAPARDMLDSFRKVLGRYGLDGENVHSDGSMGMYYGASHSTSESRLESQPHVCEWNTVITCDGRLDNRDRLILELGLTHTPVTDVDIVSESFRHWGTDCFRRLIGDWAICIWNQRKHELILARDYIGVKPLFYYVASDKILWSSHLVGLALCGDHLDLSEEYVAGYLGFQPEERLTPYQQIRAVRPGSFVRINATSVVEASYRSFDPGMTTGCKTDGEYEEMYRYLFGQAVRRRLRSNGPILAELSGGYDSSAVTCMADHVLATLGADTPRIDTFTFVDPSEPDEQDSFYSTIVEKKRGRAGHRLVVQEFGDMLCFEKAEFSASPNFQRQEVSLALPDILRQGNYKAILSGFGGDEVNGQAFDFRISISGLLLDFDFASAAKQIVSWSLLTGIPFVQLAWQSVALLLPASVRAKSNRVKNVAPWIVPCFASKHAIATQFLTASEGRWMWRPAVRDAFQTLNTFRRQLTNQLPPIVEKRYPFLDQDLLQFLFSVPPDQLLRPGERRWLMRRALRSIVPEEVLSRQTKESAGRCIALTLEKHWGTLEPFVNSPIVAEFGIVDAKRFRDSLTEAKHGKIPDQIVSLLKTLGLELWLRDNIGRGIIRPGHFRSVGLGKFFRSTVENAAT